MNYFIKNLSTKKKVAIISIITIIAITAVGIFASSKLGKKEVEAVNASNKKLALEEEVVPVIKEEIIQISQDNSIDESLIEDKKEEEKEVEVAGKKVAVPKSKVAPVNSAEDPERNKKKGGDAVSQEQVNSTFENIGAKSSGIDVSAHQGKINWAAVKAAGVDFAMIRCGFRGYGTGAICEDAYFKTNVAGATANGIKVGIYFYSAAINEDEAFEEAVWVISKIKTYRITYPVVYDFEDFQRHRCANVDGAQATKNAITFLNLVRQAGYEPMMYASKNDISNKMSRGSFSNYKFWLAHYTSGGLSNPTDYSGAFNMWQYTSKGTVDGINGNVDMNVAYFSYGTVAAPKHEHDFSEVVKNSEKAPTCTEDGTKVLRCSCGDTQTEKIPKLGHKLGKFETVKEATCKEEGLKVKKCSSCSYEEQEKVAKVSHKFGKWEITKEATIEEEGLKTRVCTVCQKEETEKIEKKKEHTEHTWVEDETNIIEPTCTENGSKILKCTECTETKKEVIPATGHQVGEWIIDKEPTETENGSKHQECTICHEKIESATIPAKEEEKEPESGNEVTE